MNTLQQLLPHGRSLVEGLGDSARYDLVEVVLEPDATLHLPGGERLYSVVVIDGEVLVDEVPGDRLRSFSRWDGFHTCQGTTLTAADDGTTAILIACEVSPSGTPRVEGLLELDRYTVDKPWGHEVWLTQNIPDSPYALKQIHMKQGFQSSLQSHDNKTETNYLVVGQAKVLNGMPAPANSDATIAVDEIPSQVHDPGSAWTSVPRILHRVIAMADYTAIEISTPELDDVVRWSDDSGRGSGRLDEEHRSARLHRTTELLELYTNEQEAVRRQVKPEVVHELLEQIVDTYSKSGTVYAAANGGNAGTLDHFLCDFRHHPFASDDKRSTGLEGLPPLRFCNLAGSASELTGLANDRGFENVFACAIERVITADDLLMVFSGSGNSPNIVAAVDVAKKAGATVFSMSKGSGGTCAELADLALVVEGSSEFPGQTGGNDNNFHFEDVALSLNHILVGLLRDRLGEQKTEGGRTVA